MRKKNNIYVGMITAGLFICLSQEVNAQATKSSGEWSPVRSKTVHTGLNKSRTSGARTKPLNVIELAIALKTKSKSYMSDEPELAYEIVSGKLLGQDSLVGRLHRVSGESTGSYAIDLGTVTAGPRYKVSLVPAAFRIVSGGTAGSLNQGLKDPDGFVLKATNILSPNGDGVNDRLVISGLEDYPKAAITITSKKGMEVYKNADYRNDWNGTAGGSVLPEGTYYYQVDFGGARKSFKGFVTLVNSQ